MARTGKTIPENGGRGEESFTHTLATGIGPERTLDTASRELAEPSTQRPLSRGETVGRYIVLDQIGEGGVAVVYAAYDPDMDRRVALKLLQGGRDQQSDAHERLVREAQALAQLSHPNVVAAYDVGTIGRQVFVAMELVEGKTLKDWILEDEPTIEQVVEAMVAAGRGVDAAHRAGLIHRDLKPSNIIVGADGRVRVLDFGLARAIDVAPDAASTDADAKSEEITGDGVSEASRSFVTTGSQFGLRSSLTVVGTVMGTPHFMAPEQWSGAVTDEKSDQFSYCATLYYALYRQHAFPGKSFTQIRRRIVTGAVRTPPAGARVPTRLRRIVYRGLSVDREARFPSMQALLAELGKDVRARRRRLAVGGGMLVVTVASVAVTAAVRSEVESPCQPEPGALAGAWDPDVEQRVVTAFKQTGRPYALDTAARIAATLDQRAGEWRTMRLQTCEATRVHGVQSENMLDLRMRCLDRRRDEIAALTSLFATAASGEMVDKAVTAIANLTPLARCADVEELGKATPLPSDPERRARIEDLRLRLTRASAERRAGRARVGLEIAADVLAEVGAVDYPPVRAEALYAAGTLHSDLGEWEQAADSLKRAMPFAAVAQDDRLRADATNQLLWVTLEGLARYDDALMVADFAAVDVARAGDDPLQKADLLLFRGMVRARQGDFAQGRSQIEAGLELAQRARGEDDIETARFRQHLAFVLQEQGDYAAAYAMNQRMLEIRERALGPTHPDVGEALNSLGANMFNSGNFAEARGFFERAVAVWEPAGAPRLHAGLSNLGKTLDRLGRRDESLPYIERALDLIRKIHGPDHPYAGYSLFALGEHYEDKGECESALPYFHQAIALWEKAFDSSHILLGHPLTGLGECLVELRRADEAIPVLERGLAIREAKPRDLNDGAKTRFALARALWATGRDRERARQLVRRALSDLEKEGELRRAHREKVRAWMDERGIEPAGESP